MKRLFSALLLAGLVLTSTPATAQDKIKVVASFSILGDMVRQVTGDLAEVTTIVGPDADAHVYTPNAAGPTMVVTSAKSPVTWRTISPRMEKLATTLILSWAVAGTAVRVRPASNSALKNIFMGFLLPHVRFG